MSRIAGLVVLAVLMALVAAFPAGAQVPAPPKTPTAEGRGGSAASVDPLATQAAIDVLRSGGNAVDAAVAAAGVLGVVEPFSCGIGGGGFMVIYDAKRRRVDTIDSREAAPAALAAELFREPDQLPSQFDGGVVERAERRRARHRGRLGDRAQALRHALAALAPAPRRADRARGLRRRSRPSTDRSTANAGIFDDFTSTRDLYLPGGAPTPGRRGPDEPRPGRDLRAHRRRPGPLLPRRRSRATSRATVQHPPEAPDSDRPHDVHPGGMTTRDLSALRGDPPRPDEDRATAGSTSTAWARRPRAARPSARRSTSSRASRRPGADPRPGAAPLPRGVQARLRRPRRVPRRPGLRLRRAGARPALGRFAAERRALIGETARCRLRSRPAIPSSTTTATATSCAASSDENAKSTTHLTVADRWGNVVSYTFTIEQIGGNGMVVPGRGFLLNNELTDFNFASRARRTRPPRASGRARAWRRRSCSTAGGRSWRSARRAARRSSPPCCRRSSTTSTSG